MRARKYAEGGRWTNATDHEEIADWLTGVPSSVKKEKRGTDPRKNNDVVNSHWYLAEDYSSTVG